MLDRSPVLLMLTPADEPYVHKIKPLLRGRQAFACYQNPDMIAEVELYAKSKETKYVISTNVTVLNKLGVVSKHQSIDNWAGSLYERNGITYLFINPLKHFYTVPYGEFIAKRFISKITAPEEWELTPDFSWETAEIDNIERWYELFKKAIIIAEDIETKSFEAPITWFEEKNITSTEDPEFLTTIRCVSYTALWQDGNIHTIVIPICEADPLHQSFWIAWMRKFNQLKIPKIFQNGNYDNAHMLCYGSPVWGYLWDTQSLFHSWYCELPKSLDFIMAFCIHSSYYWKDIANEGSKYKLFEYNARDSWATLCSWMYLVKQLPDWAWTNYKIKFPVWVPALCCNLEGWKINEQRRRELTHKYITEYETLLARLRTWFGAEFNPRSPDQVKRLIHFYGSPDIDSSDEISLKQFALRHPLNARFAETILTAREVGKVITTYLKPANYTLAKTRSTKRTYIIKSGRLFYTLNPDGTDSTRMSSGIGFTWTGAQIQNWPQERIELRSQLEADDGFVCAEVDGEQAEARGVAYLSGDAGLIETVESGRDYHAINVERFFGIPYDEVVRWNPEFESWDTLNKPIRNLSKRTNHGANYNMTWYMLYLLMGDKAVQEAKRLLNLPKFWNKQKVCGFLLERYELAYPTVKTDYYRYIITLVKTTKKLVSALGWTRYCFENPDRHKNEHDSLVAHPSQNLIVMIINEGFKDIYWQIQRKYPRDFRLKAQVHDSVPFQFRKGCEELVDRARKLCIRPIQVKDCKGITRTMVIPFAAKVGPNWEEMKPFKLKDPHVTRVETGTML